VRDAISFDANGLGVTADPVKPFVCWNLVQQIVRYMFIGHVLTLSRYFTHQVAAYAHRQMRRALPGSTVLAHRPFAVAGDL
jgi:hypothetical protein